MTHSLELIILWTTKVGEKSIVLHTISREWGRRSFITTVPKGSGMALFQPLGIINAEVTENAKSELWRLGHAIAVEPLPNLRQDIRKNAVALFMSEVLYRTVREGIGTERLYDWCRRSILTLDALQSDFSNFHLRFLMEFACELGFSPAATDLAPFAGNHFRTMSELLGCSLSDFLLRPLSGEARNEIADALVQYIGYHCEMQIKLRSLPVLRELFS